MSRRREPESHLMRETGGTKSEIYVQYEINGEMKPMGVPKGHIAGFARIKPLRQGRANACPEAHIMLVV